MANTIKVLMVKPGETSYTAEIGNNLRSMQAAVEGLIEVFPLGGSGLLVCNGEGKINSMPGNRRMDNGDIIAGPFFIARDNSRGGFASLTGRWPITVTGFGRLSILSRSRFRMRCLCDFPTGSCCKYQNGKGCFL